MSPGAVASAVGRARATALTWAAVEALSDDALERTLYGPTPAEIDGARPEPDLAVIHQELRRPGVTLCTPARRVCRGAPDRLPLLRVL